MRKIREALRLHYDAGLGLRAVSRSLKASPSTVREYLVRAKLQGLTWPLPESLDDAGLLQRLYPTPASSSRALPVPDWSKVHRELRRKGVTRSTEVLRTMSLPPSSAPIATGWSDSLPGGFRTR